MVGIPRMFPFLLKTTLFSVFVLVGYFSLHKNDRRYAMRKFQTYGISTSHKPTAYKLNNKSTQARTGEISTAQELPKNEKEKREISTGSGNNMKEDTKIIENTRNDKNDKNRDSVKYVRSVVKEETRRMYKDKIKSLKSACQKNNIKDFREPRHTNWFFSANYSLLFCINPKAGSTTMRRYFAYLLHQEYDWKNSEQFKKEFKIPDRTAGNHLQQLSKSGLNSDLYVFTIVRHPFSHLVSAYWKFADYKEAFTGRLNEAFKFHNASTDQPLSPSQLSEFILYRDPWGPAFGHFLPYHKSCNYCDYDFDAIVDTEEMNDMIPLIADKLNITEWQIPAVNANTRMKESVSDDAKMFFSNITLSTAKKLYEFYRLDFELFGYDPEPYYKYCQK